MSTILASSTPIATHFSCSASCIIEASFHYSRSSGNTIIIVFLDCNTRPFVHWTRRNSTQAARRYHGRGLRSGGPRTLTPFSMALTFAARRTLLGWFPIVRKNNVISSDHAANHLIQQPPSFVAFLHVLSNPIEPQDSIFLSQTGAHCGGARNAGKHLS